MQLIQTEFMVLKWVLLYGEFQRYEKTFSC